MTHVDQVGWEDDSVTVTDLPRSVVARHPWALSGGGRLDVP